MNSERFSDALTAARQARRKLPDGLRCPLDLDEAYRAGLAALDGEPPAAFKLGGTNARTRAAFNVVRPYFGALRHGELAASGDRLDPGAFIAPVVEPEIVIAFDRDWAPAIEPRDHAELRAGLGWVSLGLEVPDTPLCHPPDDGIAALLADRCAAGALVIGDHLDPDVLDQLEAGEAEMSVDGQSASRTVPDCRLIGGVLDAVRDVLCVFGVLGVTLPAGTPIATGGLAPAIPLTPGSRISVELAGHAVEFDYRPA